MSSPRLSESARSLLVRGQAFQLAGVDPDSTPGYDAGKKAAAGELETGRTELVALQEKLFAASRFGGTRSVLLVLQAMDTAGKGGIVRHVMSGLDPQGVKVVAFKKPTDEEREHDFLWRIRPHLPAPGYIGVFDRSHYEDVLIHRVRGLSTPAQVEERYDIINSFEADVSASGTVIIKVMLHISLDEQADRLRERLERPEKHWKFSPVDIDEREHWDDYQSAYQVAIDRTSTSEAPWFVVPANKKYYARLAVQRLLLDALTALELEWPTATFDVSEQVGRLDESL